MIKSGLSIRSWWGMALAVAAGACVLFISPQAHAASIYLQDSSGRIGYVNTAGPVGVDQAPQGVFITSGNMADIAFGTTNRLWGISNENDTAHLYNMPVTVGAGATDPAAQTYWNTNYGSPALAAANSISVTYNGVKDSAIDYNALTFSPGQSGSGSGILYAATTGANGSGSSSLYRIDTVTGAATLIGSFGTLANGDSIISSGDLAFKGWSASSPGTLFANVTVGSGQGAQVARLASINLSTGAATLLSSTFIGANGPFDGLANSATQTGPLFTIDAQYVYSVNQTTGAGTQLFKYTAGIVTSVRGAAAFGEAIPAPAALGIFGLSLAGLAMLRRRRAA